jgi:hypothetical protein
MWLPLRSACTSIGGEPSMAISPMSTDCLRIIDL